MHVLNVSAGSNTVFKFGHEVKITSKQSGTNDVWEITADFRYDLPVINSLASCGKKCCHNCEPGCFYCIACCRQRVCVHVEDLCNYIVFPVFHREWKATQSYDCQVKNLLSKSRDDSFTEVIISALHDDIVRDLQDGRKTAEWASKVRRNEIRIKFQFSKISPTDGNIVRGMQDGRETAEGASGAMR